MIPKAVEKFPRYNITRLMDTISRNGKYAIDSNSFIGLGYMIENGQIGIMAGQNGMLTISIDNADEFINELILIKELAEERRRMGVKGA